MKEFLTPLLAQINDERRLVSSPERWQPLVELFRRDIHAMFARNELDSEEAAIALKALRADVVEW